VVVDAVVEGVVVEVAAMPGALEKLVRRRVAPAWAAAVAPALPPRHDPCGPDAPPVPPWAAADCSAAIMATSLMSFHDDDRRMRAGE
jgi:hypothetical protein